MIGLKVNAMYPGPYMLLLRTPRGVFLNGHKRASIAKAFYRNEDMSESLYVDFWRRKKPNAIDAALLKQDIDNGDVAQSEFERVCRQAKLQPYRRERITPIAAQRFDVARYGDVLFNVGLPRDIDRAALLYAKLIDFARLQNLELTGDGQQVDLQHPQRLPPNWDRTVKSWNAPALPGFFMAFDGSNRYGHYVGGRNRLRGAKCPNCQLPLMLHLTLRTDDARLGLSGLGVRELPLLFCLRCNLFEDDFVYRVVNASTIEILKCSEGNDYREEWESSVGVDEFRKRSFALRPIEPKIQDLFDKTNRWCPAPEDKFGDDDRRQLAQLLQAYNDPAISRAHREVVNQLGGRAYLYQGLMFPDCPYCESKHNVKRRMLFLANLCNDERHDFVVARDVSEYIYFFVCLDCRTIQVENRCT